MPAVHHLRVESHGISGVKPAVSRGHAEDLPHAVDLPQTHHQLSDDRVETRAEAAAGDDGGADGSRIEAHRTPRPGAMVGDERGRGSGGG